MTATTYWHIDFATHNGVLICRSRSDGQPDTIFLRGPCFEVGCAVRGTMAAYPGSTVEPVDCGDVNDIAVRIRVVKPAEGGEGR